MTTWHIHTGVSRWQVPWRLSVHPASQPGLQGEEGPSHLHTHWSQQQAKVVLQCQLSWHCPSSAVWRSGQLVSQLHTSFMLGWTLLVIGTTVWREIFVGPIFAVFTDEQLSAKIRPANKYDCTVYNRHDCTHPRKLNRENFTGHQWKLDPTKISRYTVILKCCLP
jgi:hypothetical protein